MPSHRDFETVAASQTDQMMGPDGKQGDDLERSITIPATTSPGAVAIQDGAAGAITVFPGGASSLSELKPIVVELGMKSVETTGGWQITTGTNVSVIAIGRFT